MGKHVLVVGGAGFLGLHVVADLLAAGHRVRVLDSLRGAAQRSERARGPQLSSEAELLVGEALDPLLVQRALIGIDAVIHVASETSGAAGATAAASQPGLAALLSALQVTPVARLIVASSLAVYGEGMYRTPRGQLTSVPERCPTRLSQGLWEPSSRPATLLLPWPTPEHFEPQTPCARALSSRAKEQLCFDYGRAQGAGVCALRLANVYGPGRSPAHPRANVLCGFGARLLQDDPPLLFEDGLQRRDFVSVYDAARAFRLALEAETAAGAFNIGSGRAFQVRELARRLAVVLGRQHIAPEFTRTHRKGDARHAIPNVARARAELGFEARVGLEEGLIELSAWLEDYLSEARPKSIAVFTGKELRA